MESPESFQAFLLWLGGSETLGQRKYEEARQKLTLLFRFRGCPDPESLADQTMDRTALVVTKPGFNYEGDPIAYCRGVARNIYYEWLDKLKKMNPISISERSLDLPAPENRVQEKEMRSICLDGCLNSLPRENKSLLLRYYRHEQKAKIDDRQLLATETGLGLNTLRIRVFRLRNIVRACVENCLSKDEM
jgi:DNA-directed RNA polymerase specialized sigma24 family protein